MFILLEAKILKDVFKAIMHMYERSSFSCISTTFDNKKEVACHKNVEQECNTLAYFADPYSSW
ncbi:hypothetical protein K4L44_04860 [Halosquirtibacter laminarini]|uniref:Uncharacterized protein n=1 Tax=Halosquirtibacter laminarini TaxID=3374600 RepID=A0AC61NLW1_9BACT|nr:hypothetical protein K4L44_04860 [Prolixibacteraceae bacterium]